MSTNSISCFVFLIRMVVVASPQPEPIDDAAGMRSVPQDRGGPCVVQARSRYDVRHRIPLTLFHSTPVALAANNIEQHTQMNRTQQGGKWSASTRARSRDVHLTGNSSNPIPGYRSSL